MIWNWAETITGQWIAAPDAGPYGYVIIDKKSLSCYNHRDSYIERIKKMSKSWTIELEEDGVLPLPDEFLEAADLQEGDSIEWIDRHDGSWEIRKVTEDRIGVLDPDPLGPCSRIEPRAKPPQGEPVLRLTTEDIRTVYQAVQYLDSGSVDFYVDRSNGIGPVIKARYQGEIDLTDVSTW
jgi:hypothetical protein